MTFYLNGLAFNETSLTRPRVFVAGYTTCGKEINVVRGYRVRFVHLYGKRLYTVENQKWVRVCCPRLLHSDLFETSTRQSSVANSDGSLVCFR